MAHLLTAGFVVINSLNILALASNWFMGIFWYDMMLHFLGGVWVAALSFWFFDRIQFSVSRPWLLLLLILSLVVLVGVIWEFTEFLFLDEFTKNLFNISDFERSRADTLSDLFLDILGGAAFFLIYWRRAVGFSSKPFNA